MDELLEKLKRKPGSHKGQNGKVGVIAGSKDYTGAPALASKAALRTGCDLVRTLTSEPVREVVASYSENFIVDSYSSDYFSRKSISRAGKLAEWADATVVGPGMGSVKKEALTKAISRTEKPMVIDAEAIKPALEAELSKAVFTPHEGEAEAIIERHGSLGGFAESEDVVVVLKGATDKIHTPEGKFENSTGAAAMTVGGTGDVLTGVIASLMSQGLDLEEAARLGTWINGKAGEKAAEKYGNGVLATDIVEEVPGFLV